jgi:hypothetical protein
MSLTLVLPFPSHDDVGPKKEERAQAQRALPDAPVLGLIDNGKIKAGVLLTAVGDVLKQRGAIGDYFLYRKGAMVPLTDDERAGIVARADIVISGLGDCGGCTACSTTDALRCLTTGVPSFMLASERFAFLVDATDREYGIAGLRRLFVEHPVWTRDEAWFAATAETLASTIVHALGLNSATPSSEAIAAALDDLRRGLDADGYDMDARLEDAGLTISIAARPDAGKACLMPAPQIAQVAGGMLRHAGIAVPQERIAVRM